MKKLAPIILLCGVLLVSACGGSGQVLAVDEAEERLLEVDQAEEKGTKAELDGRSFRQFEPSVDAGPRKGVALSFFDEIRLWAQYAEGDRAVNEWEIFADDYRIERGGDDLEVAIYFSDPTSVQEFPTKCTNCIPISSFSISIRNVLDEAKIEFRLNDPENGFPRPFPVFESWTEFSEDEIMY